MKLAGFIACMFCMVSVKKRERKRYREQEFSRLRKRRALPISETNEQRLERLDNNQQALEERNDTEVPDRPTLATEISKAVLECSYPKEGGNQSFAEVYHATHQLTQTTVSPSGHRRGEGQHLFTARPRSRVDSRAGDFPRSRGIDWDAFLRARRGWEGRNGRDWGTRARRSTYDSRSTSLPACTVQCVFTNLDAVDDLGYVTEAGVLGLLDNYVLDRKERLAKTRRVLACFRKLGSASEDDHCAHARKMALCFSLDLNQRPSVSAKSS